MSLGDKFLKSTTSHIQTSPDEPLWSCTSHEQAGQRHRTRMDNFNQDFMQYLQARDEMMLHTDFIKANKVDYVLYF